MYHTSQYFFMKNIAKKGSRCGANFLQLLVARQFLLVAPYFLFVTFCSLIVTFCLLLVTFLLDACYILLVTHYFLLVACYFLLVSCYCWFIAPFFFYIFLNFLLQLYCLCFDKFQRNVIILHYHFFEKHDDDKELFSFQIGLLKYYVVSCFFRQLNIIFSLFKFILFLSFLTLR